MYSIVLSYYLSAKVIIFSEKTHISRLEMRNMFYNMQIYLA